MKINKTILSLPPYISTSWENVTSLFISQKEGTKVLIVVLKNGLKVEIPNLEDGLISSIFETHAEVLEKGKKTTVDMGIPMRMGPEGIIEPIGANFRHNPEQANGPILPDEMLNKISALAKVLMNDTPKEFMPKPESGCSCHYCQIARAMLRGLNIHEELVEEPISDEDLHFKSWDVEPVGESLYLVTNPIDKNEQYKVFLGEPIGCTCGQKNCEHIKAALKS